MAERRLQATVHHARTEETQRTDFRTTFSAAKALASGIIRDHKATKKAEKELAEATAVQNELAKQEEFDTAAEQGVITPEQARRRKNLSARQFKLANPLLADDLDAGVARETGQSHDLVRQEHLKQEAAKVAAEQEERRSAAKKYGVDPDDPAAVSSAVALDRRSRENEAILADETNSRGMRKLALNSSVTEVAFTGSASMHTAGVLKRKNFDPRTADPTEVSDAIQEIEDLRNNLKLQIRGSGLKDGVTADEDVQKDAEAMIDLQADATIAYLNGDIDRKVWKDRKDLIAAQGEVIMNPTGQDKANYELAMRLMNSQMAKHFPNMALFKKAKTVAEEGARRMWGTLATTKIKEDGTSAVSIPKEEQAQADRVIREIFTGFGKVQAGDLSDMGEDLRKDLQNMIVNSSAAFSKNFSLETLGALSDFTNNEEAIKELEAQGIDLRVFGENIVVGMDVGADKVNKLFTESVKDLDGAPKVEDIGVDVVDGKIVFVDTGATYEGRKLVPTPGDPTKPTLAVQTRSYTNLVNKLNVKLAPHLNKMATGMANLTPKSLEEAQRELIEKKFRANDMEARRQKQGAEVNRQAQVETLEVNEDDILKEAGAHGIDLDLVKSSLERRRGE